MPRDGSIPSPDPDDGLAHCSSPTIFLALLMGASSGAIFATIGNELIGPRRIKRSDPGE
jgi:hypothetical protein